MPIGKEWPQCCFHHQLHLCLVAYVGNFKLAGPTKNLKKGWALLRGGILIEPEQPIGPEGRVYLGCRQIVSSVKLPNGGVATVTAYDMEAFLEQCVEKYLACSSANPLYQAHTRFSTTPEGMIIHPRYA